MRHFPVETRIVEMDDDIDSLIVCPAPGAWGLSVTTCGALASRRKSSLWSIYGVQEEFCVLYSYAFSKAGVG